MGAVAKRRNRVQLLLTFAWRRREPVLVTSFAADVLAISFIDFFDQAIVSLFDSTILKILNLAMISFLRSLMLIDMELIYVGKLLLFI